MQFEDEERPHKCHLCDKSYKKKSTLKNHLIVHEGIRSHICNLCGKGFTRKDYLTSHVKLHTAKKPFQCPICPLTFATKGNFRRHTQRHQGEKNYFCQICNKGFTTDSNLLVHMKTHSTERPHVCSICSKDFLFRGALQRHIDNVHLAEKLDVCTVFSAGGFLTVRKKEDLSERPYSCSICERSFDDKVAFKRHLHSHEGKKTFNCGICSDYFENYTDLEWHLRSHLGMEPYTCNICNKKFLENYRLSKHMQIHEREYQVVLNNENSNNSNSGECSDVNDVNSSSKPFKCILCPKHFGTKHLRHQHMKIHSGIRPHKCSVCGKGFIYNSKLQKHMKAHGQVSKLLDQSEDNIEEDNKVEFNTVLIKEEETDENEFDNAHEGNSLKEEVVVDCDVVTSLSPENIEDDLNDLEDTVSNNSIDDSSVIEKECSLDKNKANKSNVSDGEFIAVFSENEVMENSSDEDPCSHDDDNGVDPLA